MLLSKFFWRCWGNVVSSCGEKLLVCLVCLKLLTLGCSPVPVATGAGI